jgi:hypothetical protein
MDYDSPYFVASVKKTLRYLAGETDEDKRAANEQARSQVEKELPSPIPHELHVSDSTIDRIKAKTAHEKRHERWKDFIETAGVGVVALYTLFAAFQWIELNTQNINQSAATMSASAAADRALRQNIVALHADQRAWIVPVYDIDNVKVLSGVRLIAPVTVVNTGKTPAHDVEGVVYVQPLNNNAAPPFNYHPLGDVSGLGLPFRVGLMFPNMPKPFEIPGGKIGPKFLQELGTTKWVALYGQITYSDIFDHPHWIHFCSARPIAVTKQTLDARTECRNYNDTDRSVE